MTSVLDQHLAFLERVRPLTRSELPYTVLWTVVTSTSGLTREDERSLRGRDRNSGRVLDVLEGAGLTRRRDERWQATEQGRHLVRALEKATASPPATVIDGRRLLAVGPDRDGGIERAEQLLAARDADVLHADGPYELVAVLPDDHALVHELKAQLGRAGHRVLGTRIVHRG